MDYRSRATSRREASRLALILWLLLRVTWVVQRRRAC
jgi:hypothetical protein